MTVRFLKLNDDAILPYHGTAGAAGVDLFTVEEYVIKPGETVILKTGIACEIPGNTFGMLAIRSGTSIKQSLSLANGIGVIDSDYRGEIGVPVFNRGDKDIHIGKKERVAQLLILPCHYISVHEVTYLTDTERGSGGFGSTGTK